MMIYFDIIIFILGILIGSFLNVCIYRIPKNEEIVYTPSHCMNCGKKIKWYDLVPIVSYILLKGRCRHCKVKLSIQYPLVELINGLVYIWLFRLFGFSFSLIIGVLLFSCLFVISIIDLQTRTIPNGLNIFVGILAVINVAMNRNNVVQYLVGFFVVSALFLLIAILTKGKGMGGGDIKLMAVAGLLLGPINVIIAMLISSIIATTVYLPFIMIKVTKKQYKFGTTIPFGPFLCMGIMTAYIWGSKIWNWYISFYK